VVVLLVSLLMGCSVSAPGSVETSFMTGLKRNLTVGGKKYKNPFPQSAENIAEGRRQFQNYCTSCHGETGRNEGVLFAQHMSPPVPRLDSPQVQGYSDGQLKWVISNGVSPSGMPAWKGTLDEAEMWKIVTYIRSLRR
jgi:mono/diheme cytochrome c family protein